MAPSLRRTKRERARGSRSVIVRRRKITPAFLVLFCVGIITILVLNYFGLLPHHFFKHDDNQDTSINVEVIKSQELSIHFLELGNRETGDCTLIKVGNTEVLIDAGSRSSSIPTIKNYLDQYVSDQTIEYVVVTHAHQDHYAGFATKADETSLLDLYQVDTVIQFAQVTDETKNKDIYKNYIREVEECNAEVYSAKDCIKKENGGNNVYQLSDDIDLEILDQRYYYEVSNNENNHSVCCQIVQKNDEENKYYLFTGDLEKAGEVSLVASNELHQVELYKAGHHGSKTSSNDVLLEVIKPKNICVCCCAGSTEYKANPENRFPSQAFIDRIAPYTDQVFVTTLSLNYDKNQFTSMNGNIVITCNKFDTEVEVHCSHNKTILKNTQWFADNRVIPDNWLV